MTNVNNEQGNGVCGNVRSSLSEYIDSTLPAGRAWKVEKHLAGCASCARAAAELKSTVDLLHAAPRFDTSDHFMASLHARLDTVDPAEAPREGIGSRMLSWILGGGNSAFATRVPALSLGLAVAAGGLIVMLNRPISKPAYTAVPGAVADGVHVSIASSTNNPFSDPAADNLEFRSSSRANRAEASF